MKRLLMAVMGLSLAGCYSPSDLRQSAPRMALQSESSATDVVACVVGAWEKRQASGNISVRPLPNGGTSILIIGHVQQTVLVVDVRPRQSGSQTQVFAVSYVLGLEPYLSDVRTCAS